MRSLVALVLCAVSWPSPAVAQDPRGLIQVQVTTADGATPDGAVVDVLPADSSGAGQVVAVAPGRRMVAVPAPSPTVVVRIALGGFEGVQARFTIAPGEVLSVVARLARVGTGTGSTLVERDRITLARQLVVGARTADTLPGGSTVWSLLETVDPFVIADRVDGGGQWPGEPARLGGEHGSPAAQTTFRVDGIDLSDPRIIGAPATDADLGKLDAIAIQTAALDPSAAGAGPLVDLVIRRPSTLWSGDGRVTAAPVGLQDEGGEIPSISRLDSGIDGSVSAGGPVGATGVGLFVSGRGARARRVERGDPMLLEPSIASAMAHLVAARHADSELRVFAAVADAIHPLDGRARFASRDLTQRDRDVTLHATVERQRAGAVWTIGAGWQRTHDVAAVDPNAAGGVMERLRDGAPLDLVAPADTSASRWDVQLGVSPAPTRWLDRDHMVRLGVSIAGTGVTSQAGAQPAFRELVNGVPARVWDVRLGPGASRRSATAAGAFASDRIALSDRVTLMAALRADWDRGSADGASSAIDWFSVTPRATIRWRLTDRIVVTSGYGWYGHRLPPSYLAVGDPSGPSGVMYRWDDRDHDGRDTPSELTAVAAVGGPALSRIGDLRRPTTGEFRVGIEQTIGSWRWGITGLDRRMRHLPALVNTGVTAADYAVSFVDDPGVDVEGRSGFEPLPIFDRRPESFLHDAYELRSLDDETSRYQGFEVNLDRDWNRRWFVRFGGNAYRSEGIGANRGYRPDENEQGGLGEAYLTPNATTNARGRLFSDRAFVMKVLGAYKGPGPVGASLVARYQDGQPFARLVVADGLGQGRDIIQAYPRGAQRFTYTLTVDARVDVQLLRAGRRRASLALEAFNLPNMHLEAEEDIVTGRGFRTVTLVQPPRVVRVGLTLAF